MAASKWIAAQCFKCLNVALQKYKQKVRFANVGLDLPAIINEGFALIELTDQANITFGGILFVTYLVGIMSTISGLYFAVGFVGSTFQGELTPSISAVLAMSVCIITIAQGCNSIDLVQISNYFSGPLLGNY